MLPKIVPLVMLWWNSRESVEKRKHNDKGTTSDFLIPISFQPNVIDWIAGRSPQHGPSPPRDYTTQPGNPGVTPIATRSGRVSRPPARFSPTAEARLETDTRAALRKSLNEQRLKDQLAAKEAKIRCF